MCKRLFQMIGLFVLLTAIPCGANYDTVVTFEIDNHQMKVNGQTIEMATPPIVDPLSGRSMVPLAWTAAALGIAEQDVTWVERSGQVVIYDRSSGDKIHITVGDELVHIYGIDGSIRETAFDIPPFIVENRMLVPYRAIAELLGAEVFWNAKYKKVTMIK